jgi:hypothetical protein
MLCKSNVVSKFQDGISRFMGRGTVEDKNTVDQLYNREKAFDNRVYRSLFDRVYKHCVKDALPAQCKSPCITSQSSRAATAIGL